jgi:hypothetical protein
MQATYEFAKEWTPWLRERGVNVITVCAHNNDVFSHTPEKNIPVVYIPAFTQDGDGHVNGMLKRECTQDWKVAPMREYLRVYRRDAVIEMWLGITIDEIQRMRHSDVKYIVNRYPLIEKRMSRTNCVMWLQNNGIDVPSKSSCVFCPFHKTGDWCYMKDAGGRDWRDAITTDELIRKARPPYDLFLFDGCVPLASITTPKEAGQLEMPLDVCDSGYCFV